MCATACAVTAAPCRGRVHVLRLSSYVESFSQSGSLVSRACPLAQLAAAAAAAAAQTLSASSSVCRLVPLSISPFWERGQSLTDGLLAGQRRLQGRAGGGQVWTGAGLKHGGDVEGLEGGGRHKGKRAVSGPHTPPIIPLFINTTRDKERGGGGGAGGGGAYCPSKPRIRGKQIPPSPLITVSTKAVWKTPDTTYHPVCRERPLDEARDHVRRVVPVVGDAGQAGVDGDHD